MSGWRFLPEGSHLLAPGEDVLWQGRPTVNGFVRRVLHVRAVTGYFAVLALWNFCSAHADGMRAADATAAALRVGIPALAAAALLYAVAWVLSATTHYMITEKRIILQIGVALPIALTVPLRFIGAADMKRYPDGTGDITVDFSGDDRLAYLLLWPHAQPGHYKKARPMLRCVPDAHAVAAILAKALLAASPEPCRITLESPSASPVLEPARAAA